MDVSKCHVQPFAHIHHQFIYKVNVKYFCFMHNMTYNSENNKLVYREYGRNVQRLVEQAVLIENREKRNQAAYAIIALMGQMHPHLKNIEEFRHKLWDQLYAISDFKLDIDAPYPKPTREQVRQQPEKIEYPQERIRFKHYGKNVENLIAKAIKMPPGEKRLAFAKVIAGYMKMVYRNWNQEHVNDEIIKNDLSTLSKGVLDLSDDTTLSAPKTTPNKKRKRIMKNGNGYHNGNHKRRYRDR